MNKQHEWIPSTLGHGTLMCKQCLMTDREAAALGALNVCNGFWEKDPKTGGMKFVTFDEDCKR